MTLRKALRMKFPSFSLKSDTMKGILSIMFLQAFELHTIYRQLKYWIF